MPLLSTEPSKKYLVSANFYFSHPYCQLYFLVMATRFCYFCYFSVFINGVLTVELLARGLSSFIHGPHRLWDILRHAS